MKPRKELVRFLNQTDSSKPLRFPCALDRSQDCCQGAGYQITTSGPYVSAKICSCVTNCPSCLGKALRYENGFAAPCKNRSSTPHPIHAMAESLNLAQIPARYQNATIPAFSNNTGNCHQMIERISSWLNSFDGKNDKGLLISGTVGVGKTYILAALAIALCQKGISVKFVDFFQLIAQIKQNYSLQLSDQELIAPLINVDVLIIDEMGKGRNTDFELTIIDQLVMGRYNQNKTIIASTNCSLKNQQKPLPHQQQSLESSAGSSVFADFGSLESRVGSRIFSRLTEMTHMIELKGEDFRKKRGSQWNAP